MDDVDAVIQLLPLQEGVQVLQQVDQVLLSVPVGNEDGDPLQGLTFLGTIAASGHFGVLCLYFLQSEVWLKQELALASCDRHKHTSRELWREALRFTQLIQDEGLALRLHLEPIGKWQPADKAGNAFKSTPGSGRSTLTL